nr:MAG: RNA-dependent RNA polymerase [Botourmiaviridae sp.]
MVKNKSHRLVTRRVCSEAQRTASNLHLATETLRRESLIPKNSTFSASALISCKALVEEWKEWTSQVTARLKNGEDKFRFLNAIKGMKTLFDEPCHKCDPALAEEAQERWKAKAFNAHRSTSPDVLSDIRRRTRRIMGKGWWKGDKRVYVPDQQGCLEMARGWGGTLSVDTTPEGASPSGGVYVPLDRSGFSVCQEAEYAREDVKSPACRLGVAKSKGKLRVVTMQSSWMKRELRPVHEHAYDRLTKRPWLVRGDVTAERFESLRSALGPGHLFNSGDYEASTDNLHKDAVLAVVETLAEQLPKEKGKLFVSSFRDCVVREWNAEGEAFDFPVVRGSMMGNLGSFVVLCILNRICYERALNLSGYSRHHPSLLNGDDILFPGCDGLFYAWLHCTKEVGFVINQKKTMRSARYGDLNSQTYRYDKSRMVRKLCFGFLGSDSWKEPVGSLAAPLFDLCRQVKFSTATWLLTTFPVRKLLARAPIPLSSIPRRWWSFLVKKNWFRGLMDRDDPAVDSVGTERKLPFVLGPPIVSSAAIEEEIREADDEVTRDIVKSWVGVPVNPVEQSIPHGKFRKFRSKYRLSRKIEGWSRLWLAPVLEAFTSKYPHLIVDGHPDWIDEQPGLQISWRLHRTPCHIPLIFSPPPPLDYLPMTGPDGPFRIIPHVSSVGGIPIVERMWNAYEMDQGRPDN